MKETSPQKLPGASLAPKRRRLRPEQRRVELMDAALQVLRELGPKARVEDVTKAAGAAKGTFYLYFSSWEDLLFQVREHIALTYALEVGERFARAAAEDWWAAFEKECVLFVDYFQELGPAHQAIYHGPIEERPFDSALSSESFISRLLQTGMEAGACRTVVSEITARLLFSALHSTADNIAQTGNREENLEALLDMLRRWLRKTDRQDRESFQS